MLRHGFEVGVHARVGRVSSRSAPVDVLYEPAYGYACGRVKRRTAAVPAGAARCDGVEVDEVHRVYAVMPVVSTERTPRQRVLHDVEELPVTGEQFQLAVVEQVVGATDAWCHLVSEAEIDRWVTYPVRRQVFLVKPDAQVQGQPMADGPRVLCIDTVVVARCSTDRCWSVSNREVTCRARADCGATCGGVVCGDDSALGYACRG